MKKICTKCGVPKPESEFYMRDGKRITQCKDCKREYQRGYDRIAETATAEDRAKKLMSIQKSRRATVLYDWIRSNQIKRQEFRVLYSMSRV